MTRFYKKMKLKESEQNYERLVRSLPDGLIVHCDLRIVFANEAALKILGVKDDRELLGKPISRFLHPDYTDNMAYKTNQFLQNNRPSTVVNRRLLRKDGKVVEVEVRAVPIHYGGKPAVQLIIHDRSDQLKMEATLNETFDLYRTLVESVVAGVFVERDLHIEYANPYLADMLGYKVGELIGMPVHHLMGLEELIELRKDDFFKKNSPEKQFAFRLKVRHKDGRVLRLEGNGTGIQFYGRGALLGTLQDVTMKYEQEQLLEQHAKLYQRMLQGIPEPICITHRDEILYMNRYAADLIGVSDERAVLGTKVTQYLQRADMAHLIEDSLLAMKSDEPTPFKERRLTLPDGRGISVEISQMRVDNYMGKSVLLSVVRDLTERKLSEEQIIRSEKLSIVGQLAAGVAHEIRNPLTSLKGFTQLLRSRTPEQARFFDIMETEIDRINLIVNEFMTLAKPHYSPFETLCFEEVMESVLSVLNTQAILLNVEIVYTSERNLPKLYCNGNQLKQVFMNVIKNALEAMPDGGTIEIMVVRSTIGEKEAVRVLIQDEGTGIPEELLKRLGEPFMTTKEQGTGLGLMVSTRIIEAHHGTINFKSGERQGTAVEIVLPVEP